MGGKNYTTIIILEGMNWLSESDATSLSNKQILARFKIFKHVTSSFRSHPPASTLDEGSVMDCVWKAGKFQAPPCLNDTGCLSVCLLFFPFFFCKAHQPPAAAVTHMRTDKALNATFEDERQLDAMQISAFI